ncbi:DRTGG domain-containing protein [Halobacteroides halobius DSM 5150]|uniref:DRTGG domain-containing protein n=1 Tax=Halobacteroides halobius (strain ATCC 35273 / DSM 5150 / MD-1) TaxID=748449 RepID=L0K9F2_HALHC|nr:DRTGG domain-containing protein [Halobacteroides halobius]AGB41912.1 DRTGG domain-containing protein [Halobacteroides halobius DSM 5150]
MKLKEIVNQLELEIVVEGNLDAQVTGGYACDLLSNVMANANKGDLWLTIQGHQNIVAVSLLVEAAGIIVVEDFEIDEETIEKALEKEVTILRSTMSTYELAGQLYKLGVE